MLFRLVAADLRTVLKKNILTFIAIAAVTVANLVYAYGLSSVYGVRTNALGFADNLALVFAGSAPFEPRPGLMFVPPLGWLFVILLILYTTLDYPTIQHSIIRPNRCTGLVCKRLFDAGQEPFGGSRVLSWWRR